LAANHDVVDQFDNTMFNRGFSSIRVTLDGLARWLLGRSGSQGSSIATQDLIRYLALPFSPADEILVIRGVTTDRRFELFGEIFLEPHKFSDEDEFGSHDIPCAKLVRPVKLTKTKSVSEGSYEKTDTLERIVECVSVIGPCSPIVEVHTIRLEYWTPFGGYGGATSPFDDISKSHQPKVLTEEDVEQLRQVLNYYFGMPGEIQDHLRIPLQRLGQALRRHRSVDRAIDLGVALESLLLANDANIEQLSLTLRLRGAWLLGNDASERRKYYEILKSIYGYRSKAVHTGKLKETNQTREMLTAGSNACALAIIRILERGGFPKWEDLVLGGE
jgi:hypothetical protein